MKSPGDDEGGELSHWLRQREIASSTSSSGVETATRSLTSICYEPGDKIAHRVSSRWFGAARRNSKQKSSVKREAATNWSSLRQGLAGDRHVVGRAIAIAKHHGKCHRIRRRRARRKFARVLFNPVLEIGTLGVGHADQLTARTDGHTRLDGDSRSFGDVDFQIDFQARAVP